MYLGCRSADSPRHESHAADAAAFGGLPPLVQRARRVAYGHVVHVRWQRLHEVLLDELRATGRLDLSRAVIDSSHVRALKGGPKPGGARSAGEAGLQAPRDLRCHRHPAGGHLDRRQSQRRHPADPATGSNPAHPRQTRPATPAAEGGLCRPRLRPRLHRGQVWARGIKPVIARRGTAHGSGLGTKRWAVEQTIALLHWFGRLRIRRETRDDIHEAFLKLGCSLICWRRLRPTLR